MKNLKLLCILFVCSFGCLAQNTIPPNVREILTSKKWIVEGFESDVYKIEFTDSKMSQSLNDNSIGDIAYYLSNNLQECNGNFVLSNVGFTTTGKYIISGYMCLELMVINDYILIFKNLHDSTVTTAAPEK